MYVFEDGMKEGGDEKDDSQLKLQKKQGILLKENFPVFYMPKST